MDYPDKMMMFLHAVIFVCMVDIQVCCLKIYNTIYKARDLTDNI